MKYFRLWMLISLILLPAAVTAQTCFTYEYEGQNILYNVLSWDDHTCRTTSVSNVCSGVLKIPEKVKYENTEYTVVAIGPESFKGEITEVIIPNTVTEIGRYAFSRCYGGMINKVTIGNSIEKIAHDAFNGCVVKELTIYAPTPPTLSVGNDFSETTLLIPSESLEAYLNSAWRVAGAIGIIGSNLRLKKVKEGDLNYRLMPGFGEDNKEIAYVSSYTGNASSVTIPDRITVDGVRYYINKIGYRAFSDNSNLKTVVFNSRCKPKKIDAYAFSGTNISNITLPSSVEVIGNYAFYNSALSRIDIPSSVRTIGAGAFERENYTMFDEIYIPSTLVSIGNDAFKFFRPKRVNISDLKAWCKISFGNENANPVYHNAYLNGEKIESLVIPDGITCINDFAFAQFNAESVTIPGSVVEIGPNAFKNANTKRLVFEYGTEPVKVKSGTFSNLTELQIDRPLDDFHNGSSKLESLTIGNSVKTIPSAVFLGSQLADLVLPPSVEVIGADAFARSNNLESIVMGSKVKEISGRAFYDAPATTVSITAQTPPAAVNDTFTNYTGKLYLQGKKALEAYYDSDYCWYLFEGFELSEPTELRIESDSQVVGKPGDTVQLRASLYPKDVSLPQIFWSSTNPAIAIVDQNGLVKLRDGHAIGFARSEDKTGEYASCKIIAESLYANGPKAEFEIHVEQSGLEDVVINSDKHDEIDFSLPIEVYNLQGAMVAKSVEGISKGIYIIRQGLKVQKIALR